ncbi:MAG: LysR family transcriptional regulator [Pseudomonadota bacterium]
MQRADWNDYRVLLAVARAGTLSGAADLLGLNATTVSRRIKALEVTVASALVVRVVPGRVQLTHLGQSLAEIAERMEQHAHIAETLIGRDAALNGTVRLTAVPFLLNRLIIPQIGAFSARHPGLHVSLVPDSQNLSLTRREVDVAIRFGAPREGGSAVLARKIGGVGFSVFTARDMAQVAPPDRPWLVYDPVAAHLPQAIWTRTLAQADGGALSTLLMHDLEGVYEAVLKTPSRALLPTIIGRRDPRLIELEDPAPASPMTRDVWLLRNKGMRGVARIDAIVDWLTDADLFGLDVGEFR